MSRERTAALAGVLYVALDIVVGVMAGAPPSPAAPESDIVAYIADHRAGLAVGLWLFGLATIPLLWWFGALWARMVHAEADTPGSPSSRWPGCSWAEPWPWLRRS